MPKPIIISNNSECIRVYSENIAYIEAEGNYSTMYLIDGTRYMFTKILSSFLDLIEKQLDDDADGRFMRIGKSLVINLDYLLAINPSKQTLVLADPMMRHKFNIKASKDALKKLKLFIENNSEYATA